MLNESTSFTQLETTQHTWLKAHSTNSFQILLMKIYLHQLYKTPQKNPTHHLQPDYPDFPINIDANELEKRNAVNAALQ